MGGKPRSKPARTGPKYEWKVIYRSGRKLTKAVEGCEEFLVPMEEEGFELCGFIFVAEIKLLGTVMRRLRE